MRGDDENSGREASGLQADRSDGTFNQFSRGLVRIELYIRGCSLDVCIQEFNHLHV